MNQQSTQSIRREKSDMKMLTKVVKSCCTTEKTAQCCAKSSRLVTGCHD